MLNIDSFISKNKRIPYRVIEEESILVDVDRGEVIHINEVGTEIWEFLQDKKKISNIIDHIFEIFSVEKDVLQKDALDFLEELIKKGILVLEGH
ncbi:MAG: PqqD family protein [Candidatus Omnitrophica bacterium]|nr:PqqD family protein [Candidatus Omnitrophota bacterium]